MGYLSNRVIYTIVLYGIIMVAIFQKKPRYMFGEEGELRPFGIHGENGETLYSFSSINFVIAILLFYIFCHLDILKIV